MTRTKTKLIAEFGDFQTPPPLAEAVCSLLGKKQVRPLTVIEPTCGRGNFLIAAQKEFPTARLIGFDINADYVQIAQQRLSESSVSVGNFFDLDWRKLLDDLSEAFLLIGNPPWVTNSELGTLGSKNLPTKNNFQNYRGLDALTGKSNFDISEWMLLKLIEWLSGREATLAMLCKTAVARKVLLQTWKRNIPIGLAEIHAIDANKHFAAAVDACLLLCRFSPNEHEKLCRVYQSLGSMPKGTLGYHEGRLLADIRAYDGLKHLEGESLYRWRSGVKHDCRNVMEFQKKDGRLINGFGEAVDLEERYLFPMLKSSELANGKTDSPQRWMLVTQRLVGEETKGIEHEAPKTWKYLNSHAELLDGRKSTIYRSRPRFSVFGVGKYTFASWKVAISGFYKRLAFTKVGSFQDKPILLDDTAYFVDCHSEFEADLVCSLLNSDLARRFYSAFIFWDAKRPITVSTLNLLDIRKLAETQDRFEELKACRADLFQGQLSLF